MAVLNRPLDTTHLGEPADPSDTFPQELSGSRIAVPLAGGVLTADIDYVDGEVVATDPESGIFGEGDTDHEAITELIEHLRIALKDLSENEAVLHSDLRPELARLRYLFRA